MPDIFFEYLFRDISQKLHERRNNAGAAVWTEILLLRAKNFKQTSAAIKPNNYPPASLDSVIVELNNSISLEQNIDIINSLNQITGIKFATATTLMALTNPKKWAILDSRLMKYIMRITYDNLNNLFENLTDEIVITDLLLNLREKLIEIDPNFTFIPSRINTLGRRNMLVEAYDMYLDLLDNLLQGDNPDIRDLRDVELILWNNTFEV